MGRPAQPDNRHGALRPAGRSDLRWLYVVEGILDGLIAADSAVADQFTAWAHQLTLTQGADPSTSWLLSRAAKLVRERIRLPDKMAAGTRSVSDRLAFGLHTRFLTPFSRRREVRIEHLDERERRPSGPPPERDRDALRRAGRTLYALELSRLPRPSVSAVGRSYDEALGRLHRGVNCGCRKAVRDDRTTARRILTAPS